MLLELLRDHINAGTGSVLFPLVFLMVFLVIGGGALYLTPRIAKWVDRKRADKPGYYDNILEEAPETVETGVGMDGK